MFTNHTKFITENCHNVKGAKVFETLRADRQFDMNNLSECCCKIENGDLDSDECYLKITFFNNFDYTYSDGIIDGGKQTDWNIETNCSTFKEMIELFETQFHNQLDNGNQLLDQIHDRLVDLPNYFDSQGEITEMKFAYNGERFDHIVFFGDQ
jgi:hypothetical protein